MAGGWNTGLSLANATDIASNLTGEGGVLINCGGSAFAKGSWTQLIASTTTDVAWLLVNLDTYASTGTRFAFDIGVGSSGNEVAVVQNLEIAQYSQAFSSYFFPLSIKAGTRVAARVSGDTGGDQATIKVNGFDDAALSAGVGSAIDTYGYSTASNTGTAVDPGSSANTKGSYTQITSSVTNDLAGFFLGFDTQTLSSGNGIQGRVLIDVAIGGSGSEKIIVPNTNLITVPSGLCQVFPASSPYFPIPIKSGTRVAVRAQSSDSTATQRVFGVTVYGVRL